jgi:hypothetical protein
MAKFEIVNEEPDYDPFNVAALRLPPSFEQEAGVRTQLTTLPVRKPKRQEWFRVHPDPEYRADFAFIKLDDEGSEYYLVHPQWRDALQNELLFCTLYTCVNRHGVVFLWPARLPSEAGHRVSEWARSAHEAAAAAVKRYTRMQSNMKLGAYEHQFSDNPTPEPDPIWPDKSMTELLKIAFQNTGRFIDTLDHSVIKQLRGR